MKTEPQRHCPSCGNEFPEAMEFCPVCMLRQGLGDGVKSGESSASEDTVKPTVPKGFEHYELVTGEDGNRLSWVAVQWASLTRRSTSICAAP